MNINYLHYVLTVAGDENVDAAFSSVVDTGAGGAGVTTASPTVSFEPVATSFSFFMILFFRFLKTNNVCETKNT